MRAVRVFDRKVELTDVPSPTGPGVRVKVRAAGICGSDLHLLGPDSPVEELSVTMGHEFAGVAENGTAVAVEPLNPCGRCEMCEEGQYNLCLEGPVILGIHTDGGMADEVMVPERALVPLPSGVHAGDAALVEPLAVLVHAFRRAQVRPDQRVVVVGGGTIGLCAVAVGRAIECEVGLVSRHEHQQEIGARLGASEVQGTYDVVVDSAGTESSLATSVELARPGAQISVPGIYWTSPKLPGFPLCLKQISLCPVTLYGRHAAGRDVDNAAALLATTPEIAKLLITHRFPLEAAAEAFEIAADRASGAVKVVLEPGA